MYLSLGLVTKTSSCWPLPLGYGVLLAFWDCRLQACRVGLSQTDGGQLAPPCQAPFRRLSAGLSRRRIVGVDWGSAVGWDHVGGGKESADGVGHKGRTLAILSIGAAYLRLVLAGRCAQ